MNNNIQPVEIQKWLCEVDEEHPMPSGGFPEILTIAEIITAIGKHLQYNPMIIYNALQILGMFDKKNKPADCLLATHCAIRSSDLVYDENAPEDQEESYLMTIRGYAFLVRMLERFLKPKVDKLMPDQG